VVQRTYSPAKVLAECLEGLRVLVVAANVLEPAREDAKRRGIPPAMRLEAGARPLDHVVSCPLGSSHADHRQVELSGDRQSLQGGKDIFERQIAADAKDD